MFSSFIDYLKENDIDTDMIIDQKIITMPNNRKYYVFIFNESIIVLDEQKEFYEVFDNTSEGSFVINNGINTYSIEDVGGLLCACMTNRYNNLTQTIYMYEDIKNAYFCQTDLEKYISVLQVYNAGKYDFYDYVNYLDKRKPVRIEFVMDVRKKNKKRVFEEIPGKINQYMEYKHKILPVGHMHSYEHFERSFADLGFKSSVDRRILDFYLGNGELSNVKNVVKTYKKDNK